MPADRPVLVTGANGLIGHALCQQLCDAGVPVIALVRPGASSTVPAGATAYELDLATMNAESLSGLPAVRAVAHLAQAGAYSDFPEGAGDVAAIATGATARLAEFAVACSADRFVFASSGGIYGGQPGPIRESEPYRRSEELGFYLATKALTEQLLKFFSGRLSTVSLRYFFVYGPRQRPRMLLPRLFRSIASGESITLSGHDGPRMNPIHVDDAALVTRRSLDAEDLPGEVNVAGEEVLSLRAICERIGGVLGRRPEFVDDGRVPSNFVADTSLMQTHLGRCRISLNTGLSTMASSLQS